EVISVFTVSVNVLVVSQLPDVLATVSVIELAPLNTCPYQVYGSWLVHTARVCVEMISAFTVNVNVLAVSQPPVVLATVSVSEPAALNTLPYQVYGSWLVHIVCVCVEMISAFTVNVNVLAVSQPPVVLATVSVSEPAALNT